MSGFPRPNINSSVADITEEALHSLINTTTGRIPLETIYDGEAFFLRENTRDSRSAGMTEEDFERNHWLENALAHPYLDPAKNVFVQVVGARDRLLDCEEIFTRLRHSPDYHLNSGDMGLTKICGPVVSPYLQDSNYLELCVGKGGKTEAFFANADALPQRVGLVDTQFSCLSAAQDRLTKKALIEAAHKRGRSVNIEQIKVMIPEERIHLLQGDWRDEKTYITRVKGVEKNLLTNMRADSAQAFCAMFGTANNFDTHELFSSMFQRCPENTLYGVTYDLTTRSQSLKKSYNFWVNQIILSGITGAARKKGFKTFDPRKIATEVEVVEQENSAIISFKACVRTKGNWQYMDSIEKIDPDLRLHKLRAASAEILADFTAPNLPPGYDIRMYLLCRADQKHKFKRLQLGS